MGRRGDNEGATPGLSGERGHVYRGGFGKAQSGSEKGLLTQATQAETLERPMQRADALFLLSFQLQHDIMGVRIELTLGQPHVWPGGDPAYRPSWPPGSTLRPTVLEFQPERGDRRESLTKSWKSPREKASVSPKMESCPLPIPSQTEETVEVAVPKLPQPQNHC